MTSETKTTESQQVATQIKDEPTSSDEDRDKVEGADSSKPLPNETEAEMKTRKRKERLEQNRISARESRKRKKTMIEELQRTVITLSRENKDLNQRNESLRRQLIEIGTKFPNAVPLHAIMGQNPAAGFENQQNQAAAATAVPNVPAVQPASSAATPSAAAAASPAMFPNVAAARFGTHPMGLAGAPPLHPFMSPPGPNPLAAQQRMVQGAPAAAGWEAQYAAAAATTNK